MGTVLERKSERIMLYCPRCKSVYAGTNSSDWVCPDCDGPLFNTFMAESDWDAMTENEKEEAKQKFQAQSGTVSVVDQAQERSARETNDIMRGIYHELHSLNSMASFLFVLFLLRLVVSFWLVMKVLDAMRGAF